MQLFANINLCHRIFTISLLTLDKIYHCTKDLKLFFNKKSFLKSEIARLANEGLINRTQEREILNFYSLDKGSDFPFLVVFAFIFIGLSILTLVAYNWQEIPNLLKTFLLLTTLFATHLGIFYSKSPLFKQSFGILSGFALLANIALLSQIYHLGEDTALAFLSVGCVVLVLAFALKSSAIFLVGYLFTSVWYFLNLVEYYHSMSLFICIIALGIIVQSGILFPISLNAKKILALPNFIFLGLYLCKIQEESLNLSAFAWLSLIILGFHFKPYKIYAYFALALILVVSSYYPLGDSFLSLSFSLPILLVVLGVVNLYFKHYPLGILIIGFALMDFYSHLYSLDTIIHKGLYSFLTLLLGIHLIKENHTISGLFVLCLLALVRYLDLLGDYIGASLIFLCFGLGLLLFARRKNA